MTSAASEDSRAVRAVCGRICQVHIYESRSDVQNHLQPIEFIDCSSGEKSIAVVDSRNDEAVDPRGFYATPLTCIRQEGLFGGVNQDYSIKPVI